MKKKNDKPRKKIEVDDAFVRKFLSVCVLLVIVFAIAGTIRQNIEEREYRERMEKRLNDKSCSYWKWKAIWEQRSSQDGQQMNAKRLGTICWKTPGGEVRKEKVVIKKLGRTMSLENGDGEVRISSRNAVLSELVDIESDYYELMKKLPDEQKSRAEIAYPDGSTLSVACDDIQYMNDDGCVKIWRGDTMYYTSIDNVAVTEPD